LVLQAKTVQMLCVIQANGGDQDQEQQEQPPAADNEWFEVMEEIAVGGVPADQFPAPNLDR
jgi:hypothetical protein